MSDTETKVYDLDETRAMLREIAAEKPEGYVYPGANSECLYREEDGTPSCIIGHLAGRLRIPTPEEGNNVNAWGHAVEVFTEQARQLMFEVQILQDGGVPWLDAVEAEVKS